MSTTEQHPRQRQTGRQADCTPSRHTVAAHRHTAIAHRHSTPAQRAASRTKADMQTVHRQHTVAEHRQCTPSRYTVAAHRLSTPSRTQSQHTVTEHRHGNDNHGRHRRPDAGWVYREGLHTHDLFEIQWQGWLVGTVCADPRWCWLLATHVAVPSRNCRLLLWLMEAPAQRVDPREASKHTANKHRTNSKQNKSKRHRGRTLATQRKLDGRRGVECAASPGGVHLYVA